MTESVVGSIHGGRARVRTCRYDPGENFEGMSRPCTVYVVDGRLEFDTAGGTIILEQEDVFPFAGGDYVLRVDEGGPATAVWVWELPLVPGGS